MNRHERRKAEKALKKKSSFSHGIEPIDTNDLPLDVRPLFDVEENIPLTPELIKELIQEKDFREEDLKQFAEIGARYSRSRNSFIIPSEDI